MCRSPCTPLIKFASDQTMVFDFFFPPLESRVRPEVAVTAPTNPPVPNPRRSSSTVFSLASRYSVRARGNLCCGHRCSLRVSRLVLLTRPAPICCRTTELSRGGVVGPAIFNRPRTTRLRDVSRARSSRAKGPNSQISLHADISR